MQFRNISLLLLSWLAHSCQKIIIIIIRREIKQSKILLLLQIRQKSLQLGRKKVGKSWRRRHPFLPSSSPPISPLPSPSPPSRSVVERRHPKTVRSMRQKKNASSTPVSPSLVSCWKWTKLASLTYYTPQHQPIFLPFPKIFCGTHDPEQRERERESLKNFPRDDFSLFSRCRKRQST